MSSFKHASMYGMAIVIIGITISLLLYVAGIYDSYFNAVSYLVYIVLLIFGIKTWRDKEHGGFISYGQAMGYSMYAALIFASFYSIWLYVLFSYIGHTELSNLQNLQMAEKMKEAKEQYHLSDEMIESQRQMMKEWVTPVTIHVGKFISYLIGLTITNLIISAFMKKDYDGFDVPPNTAA